LEDENDPPSANSHELSTTHSESGSGNSRISVRITFVNLRTGEEGAASVSTSDPDVVSPSETARDGWLRRVAARKVQP
jgi:hypothetical protein